MHIYIYNIIYNIYIYIYYMCIYMCVYIYIMDVRLQLMNDEKHLYTN